MPLCHRYTKSSLLLHRIDPLIELLLQNLESLNQFNQVISGDVLFLLYLLAFNREKIENTLDEFLLFSMHSFL